MPLAHRSLAELLRANGSTPSVWLPINLIASLEAPVLRDHVAGQLRQAPGESPQSVEADLQSLCDRGWVADDGAVLALTATGSLEHTRLLVEVRASAERLLRDVDDAAIATTIQTLQEVTERIRGRARMAA